MSQQHDPVADLSPVKRALVELRETRAKLDALERQRSEPIAIIGAGCRFPGSVSDMASYWALLRDGVDAIQEVPPDRWDRDEYYDSAPGAPGKMMTRWGGFVDGIDRFDADFFGISPREAVTMDPQQRLVLAVAWEALEHAGQAPDRLNGSATGVFVGLSTNDYAQLEILHGESRGIDMYLGTGGAHSIVTGRLSYVLGLRGPSIAVDTACSSSLVAIHLACQSLRSGECRMALAGGVNVVLLPELTVALSQGSMMATDGRCKTFDAAADGFVRAEGCGIVVLKRLSDALADGDPVLALIRGSAVNQDGRSSGLTAPNGPSQEAVIRAALAMAKVDPSGVDYVEAHGTGTALGDPIEAGALAAVFGPGRAAARPVRVGSVKTQIGHLESAAGVAGLIKVVLALQHGELPASLHFRVLNPHIAAARLPIEVVARRQPWPTGATPRRAGVSSFGFGGTNAHVVLEEAPATVVASPEAARSADVLALSAKTPAALLELADRFAARLAQDGVEYPDVCHSANTGRAHFDHRLALVARSAADASKLLCDFAAGRTPTGLRMGHTPMSTRPGVVFVFSGEGNEYAGMGRTLYHSEPAFRRAFDVTAALVRSHLDRPLLDVLLGEPGTADLLTQVAYAQPALFALEYALAELWRSWGVEPTAVIGHGPGELVAGCVAGVFSVEDAVALVTARGRLIQALPDDGAMATILADEATVRAAVEGHADVSIAAVNGPGSVVVSGRRRSIDRIVTDLERSGVRTRAVVVSRALNSPLVDPMLEAFERTAATISYAEPRIPFVSSLTGSVAAPGDVTTPRYWRRQIRETVRLGAGVETASAAGCRVFLQVGPAPTLAGLGLPRLSDDCAWLSSLGSESDETAGMLTAMATMYASGVDISWQGVYRDRRRPRVTLPTYPFQAERYWHKAVTPTGGAVDVARRWSRVVDAARQRAETGPLDLRLETYDARWKALDRLTVEHVIATLRVRGAFDRAGDALDAGELIARCGLAPIYRHLVARWLARITADGLLLAREDGRFVSPEALRAARLDEAWADARDANADLPALLEYLERCGRLMVPVLTCSESPLVTLFPGGDFRTAEFLYSGWALARYFNGIVQSAVEAVVASLPPRRMLRVIELGAGTGGTTSALLSALPPERTSYVCTDVSETLLAYAGRKFSAYPFVRYGVFDIEKSPAAQGYAEHAFDLVVAANAVHATRDLRSSLEHARALLAPGGVLVLYEVTRELPWFEMSVGLIEGWERFADDLRQDNPLLSPQRWADVLAETGFVAVETLPAAGTPAEVLGHHVILALASANVSAALTLPARRLAAPSLAAAPGAVVTTPAPAPTVNGANTLVAELFAVNAEDRHDRLAEYVREHVVHVLRLGAGRVVDRRHRLMDLGLDSLMAVELRNRLGLGLSLAVPATVVFDYPTIDAVAGFLGRELMACRVESKPGGSNGSRERAVTVATPERGDPAAPRAIAELPDEEVEAMLLRKLESL